MLRPTTLFALLAVFVIVSPARADDEPVALTNGWSVRWGDSPTGADGLPEWARDEGDAGWTPVDRTQFMGTDHHLAWLRVRLPTGTWRDPGLRVDGVTNAGEVWVGGEKLRTIGELRPEGRETSSGYGVDFIPLPDHAPGRMLYLRIQSSAGNIGLQTRPRLGNVSDLVHRAWLGGYGQALAGVILIALGLISLALFMQRRSERSLGHLAGFGVAVGVTLIVLSRHLSLLGVNNRLLMALVYIAGSWFGPELLAFVHAFFPQAAGPWLRRVLQVQWVIATVVGVMALVSVEYSHETLPGLLLLDVTGIGAALVLVARLAIRGDRDARVLLAGVLALFLVSVHDTMSSVRTTEELQIWTHWGVMALGLSMAALVVRRFVLLTEETESRAHALEKQRADALASRDRMRQGAQSLATAVSQLSGTTRDQNGALERQATTIEETRVTAEEIRQTSMLASERAQSLLGKVAEADEASRRGEASLHSSVGEVEQIGQEVGEMARRISQLEQRTREIATIVDTVKGLADQSNMLALNAAIEAVRSGEHGKGFAVVAREVRSLADQSIRATGRIRDILTGLEEGIREVSHISGRGEERVQKSVAQVRATADELRRVGELSRETSGAIRQISAAVAQQNAGISQIFTAVNDLAEQMRGTVSRLQETDSAIRAVDEVSGSLAREEKAA